MAVSIFLLDMFCLGVKNAFFTIRTKAEYDAYRAGLMYPVEPTDAAYFRKLVEGGVAYARELGFEPHPDYRLASKIFGDVDAGACLTNFEYGNEGKPLYISGPNESAAKIDATLSQLERRLGAHGFHFIVAAPGQDSYAS
jgi:hypothetical protein